MNATTELRDAVKRELTAEVIRQFGEVRLKVTGTSMLPSVWPGDMITVRRQSAADLRPGQIVLCYRDRAFVAHRLIAKHGNLCSTRGDSLRYSDQPFRDEEVLGAVVSIVRQGRPVPLSFSLWHRLTSCVVQRSELCTRILLRLQRPTWAN